MTKPLRRRQREEHGGDDRRSLDAQHGGPERHPRHVHRQLSRAEAALRADDHARRRHLIGCRTVGFGEHHPRPGGDLGERRDALDRRQPGPTRLHRRLSRHSAQAIELTLRRAARPSGPRSVRTRSG